MLASSLDGSGGDVIANLDERKGNKTVKRKKQERLAAGEKDDDDEAAGLLADTEVDDDTDQGGGDQGHDEEEEEEEEEEEDSSDGDEDDEVGGGSSSSSSSSSAGPLASRLAKKVPHCHFCPDFAPSTWAEAQKHQRTSHYRVVNVVTGEMRDRHAENDCRDCGRDTYPGRSHACSRAYEGHRIAHGTIRCPYTCQHVDGESGKECGREFGSRDALQAHMKSMHEGERHHCPHCSYEAKSAGNLKKHVNGQHNGTPYPCPHCDYTTPYQSNLKSHVDNIHKGIKHPCPLCDKQATTRSNLQSHIKRKHWKSLGGEEQSSSGASSSASAASSDGAHASSSGAGTPFKDISGKKRNRAEFEASASSSSAGLVEQGLSASSQPLTCQFIVDEATGKKCGLVYSRVDHLKRHAQAAHEGVRHSCPHCKQKATTKYGLQDHIRRMHPSKYDGPAPSASSAPKPPKVCEFVDEATGEKCGRQYGRAEHLRRHIESAHQGIRHSCPHCSHASPRRDYLQRHIRDTHEEPQRKPNRKLKRKRKKEDVDDEASEDENDEDDDVDDSEEEEDDEDGDDEESEDEDDDDNEDDADEDEDEDDDDDDDDSDYDGDE